MNTNKIMPSGQSLYMSEELMEHSRAVQKIAATKNPIKLTFNNLNYEVEI